MINKLESFFWIILLAGVFGGLFTPSLFIPFQGLIIYIVMAILLLLFLKADLLEILADIKQPGLLLYVSFINLIVTPLVIYYLFNKVAGENIFGYVLLGCLPSGVSSAAFTDIMKGRTSLTLTLIVITNLLSIITIPLMFFILFNKVLDLNSLQMCWSLFKIFFIPFFIAKGIKYLIKTDVVAKVQNYSNIIIVFLLASMIGISISFQSDTVLNSFVTEHKTLGYILMIILISQLIAYFSVSWKTKETKLAISNSNMIMNTILGIVLSIAFFPDSVVYIMVLSMVPWTLMIIIKNWYQKFLP